MTFREDATPLVKEFLKAHDCGQKENPDYYGDDWSHYDIECLVDLACELERQLGQALKKINLVP